ncbi:MAG: adenylyl-sulfate kinase [Lachnospiraceae bacterium]|nr:adenylyl-sulfate kinase [Lachnospiraceae bacterium]
MADNLKWHTMSVSRSDRESIKDQTAKTLWFTGLSGSGKSTIASALERRLYESGKHTMTLDGDNVRMGLNKNLGFGDDDRKENIRRIAEVCKLMNDAGLIVITSFISPFIKDRQSAREIIGEDSFIEVYIATSLEECERRDVKGLYKKARNGEIKEFTGLTSPYEAPEDPDITVVTEGRTVDECAAQILEYLMEHIAG